MKKIFYLFVIAVLFLSGCSTKSQISPIMEIPGVGIYTAEELSDNLGLWCEVWDIYSGKETVLTKENLVLNILPSAKDGKSFNSYYKDQDAFYLWHRDLLSEIIEVSTNNYPQEYLYAGICSGARIYADKVIFGREPGEDLGDLFKPLFSRLHTYHYIAGYPEYNLLYDIKESQPKTFREFMDCFPALGTYGFLCLTFLKTPEEDLQTVTVSIELPVEYQYYKEYTEAEYKELGIPPPGQRILKGDITIEFGKTVYTSGHMEYVY